MNSMQDNQDQPRRPPARLPPLADSPSKSTLPSPHVFRQNLSSARGERGEGSPLTPEEKDDEKPIPQLSTTQASSQGNEEEAKSEEELPRGGGTNLVAEMSDFILSRLINQEILPDILDHLEGRTSPDRSTQFSSTREFTPPSSSLGPTQSPALNTSTGVTVLQSSPLRSSEEDQEASLLRRQPIEMVQQSNMHIQEMSLNSSSNQQTRPGQGYEVLSAGQNVSAFSEAGGSRRESLEINILDSGDQSLMSGNRQRRNSFFSRPRIQGNLIQIVEPANPEPSEPTSAEEQPRRNSQQRNLTIHRLLEMYRQNQEAQTREVEISDSISYVRQPRSDASSVADSEQRPASMFIEDISNGDDIVEEQEVDPRPLQLLRITETLERATLLRQGIRSFNRAAGFSEESQAEEANTISPRPQGTQQEQIQNQFHLRSVGFAPRTQIPAPPRRPPQLRSIFTQQRNQEATSMADLANGLDHASTLNSLEARQRESQEFGNPEEDAIRQTQRRQMSFQRRRHDLWMNRNLRHQRRLAGMAGIMSDVRQQSQLLRPPSRAIATPFGSQDLSGLYPEDEHNTVQQYDHIRHEDFEHPVDPARAYENQQNPISAFRNNLLRADQSQMYLREVESHHLKSEGELVEIYNSMEQTIPKKWRKHELSRAALTQEEHLVMFLKNYGALSVLIFMRAQDEVKNSETACPVGDLDVEGSKVVTPIAQGPRGDMLGLSFLSLNNDYLKFIQRLLSFYSFNFKIVYSTEVINDPVGSNPGLLNTCLQNSKLEAKKRLEKLIHVIIPGCSELLSILKQKRKATKEKKKQGTYVRRDKDFTYDDENIIYVIILKVLESYLVEFDQAEYAQEFLPLALEFYKHHVSPSDLILVNSMVRNLNVYFPNLVQQRSLVTREEYVSFYRQQRLQSKLMDAPKTSKKSAKRRACVGVTASHARVRFTADLSDL